MVYRRDRATQESPCCASIDSWVSAVLWCQLSFAQGVDRSVDQSVKFCNCKHKGDR